MNVGGLSLAWRRRYAQRVSPGLSNEENAVPTMVSQVLDSANPVA